MEKNSPEYEEALAAILTHYGITALLSEIDAILLNIKNGCMSVPLDNDPQKASLTLYKERMKFEGALAVKTSLQMLVRDAKLEKQRRVLNEHT